MFKIALIASGILAAIALSAPGIVMLGFFLLIVPGLVLALAPTVFAYLLLIGALRRLLPLLESRLSNRLAFRNVLGSGERDFSDALHA